MISDNAADSAGPAQDDEPDEVEKAPGQQRQRTVNEFPLGQMKTRKRGDMNGRADHKSPPLRNGKLGGLQRGGFALAKD